MCCPSCGLFDDCGEKDVCCDRCGYMEDDTCALKMENFALMELE